MKISTKAFFIGSTLAVCAFSAQAVDTIVSAPKAIVFEDGFAGFSNGFGSSAVGKNFVDSYIFSVSTFSDAYGDVGSRVFKTKNLITKDLDITGISLTGMGYTALGVKGEESTNENEYWSLDAYNLVGGDYTVQVFGTVKTLVGAGNIGYSGSLGLTPIVSAVPEPATWGMLVGGLGLVGMFARRRKASERSAGNSMGSMRVA